MTSLVRIVAKRIGHLDLIEPLGNGPNGPTWLAIDTRRDRMVTLKLLTSLDPLILAGHGPHLSSAIERLTTVKSRSAVIPTASSAANQKPAWILRDYISGLDLRALCKHTGPLATNLALGILAEVADALAAYHSSGLVHGNIKRQNLLFTKAGAIKVVDPAITQTLLAQFPNDQAPTPNQVSAQAFLAPEQRSGAPLSTASDIYQFGVLACWLLSQSYPFQSTGHIHDKDTLGTLPKQLADVSPSIQTLICHALSEQPSARNFTMSDAKQLFERALSESGITPAQAIIEGLQPFQYAFLIGQSQSGKRATRDTENIDTVSPSKLPHLNFNSRSSHPKLAAAPPDNSSRSPMGSLASEEEIRPSTAYELATDEPITQTKNIGPTLAAAPAKTGVKGQKKETLRTNNEPSSGLGAPPPVLFSMTSDIGMEPLNSGTKSTSFRTITISIKTLCSGIGILLFICAGLIWWYRVATESPDILSANNVNSTRPMRIEPKELVAQASALMESDPEAALSNLEAAVKHRSNDPTIHLMLARVLKRLGRTREAADAFSRAVRLRPADVAPQQELIDTLLASGLPKQALKAATKALEHHGTDAKLYVLRARAELAEKNDLAASASLVNATRLAPENPEAWKLLGAVRSRQERWQSSRKAWQQAVGLAPSDMEAYAGLAHAIRRGGRPAKKAADLMLMKLARLPDNQEFILDVARILTKDGRLSDAQRLLQPYTAKFSEDWRGYFQLGLARMLNGEHAAASSAFEKALEIQPGEPAGWYNLGLARSADGKLKKALVAFDRAIQEYPDFSDAHCERARSLQSLGNIDAARRAYKRAAKDTNLSLAQILAAAPLSDIRSALLREMRCGAIFLPLPD